MPEEKTTIKKKIAKGKIWFKIHAPKVFEEREIGETVGTDEASIKGRVISLPLSEITGDITKHHINLGMKIFDIKGEHAYTEIVEYRLAKQYLTRMLRRHTSKIEVINDVTLEDNKKYRIKSVAITISKADRSQRSAIHRTLQKEMETRVSKAGLPNLVLAFSTGKIQKEIAEFVRKIYPVKIIEVRKIELLKEKKEHEEAPKQEK